MDLDASMEIYEEWIAKGEAEETAEVEEEVSAFEAAQHAAQEFKREVGDLHSSACATGVLVRIGRALSTTPSPPPSRLPTRTTRTPLRPREP